MSVSFKAGQKVVCVESGKTKNRMFSVEKDNVYTILKGNFLFLGYDSVLLVEMPGIAWCADRFAPLPPRSIEIPESLKEQAEEMKDLAETIAPMKKELV